MKILRKRIHNDVIFCFERDVSSFQEAWKNDPTGQIKAANEIEDRDDVLKNIQNKLYYDSDSEGEFFEDYQKFLHDGKDLIIIDSTVNTILQEVDQANANTAEIDLEHQRVHDGVTDIDIDSGLVYKGRGDMFDPKSYVDMTIRINYEMRRINKQEKRQRARNG